MDLEQYRNPIILICVGAYMITCIAVGLWAMRRTKDAKDFFMAGRNLGIMVTGLAVFSSTLSGFGFVGGPGLVYRMGMSSIWMVICSSIGFCLSFYLVGKRIRLFAELNDSISLPDVVAMRYNSELSRFLTGLAILIGVLGYLAAQIKAMATVLRDILINTEAIDSISIEVCVAISCAVLVFYCVTGGIIASVYTDVVQGGVMVVAALLVFFTAINAFDGGVPAIVTTIMADDAEAISPWGTIGLMGALSWYFVFALGGAGQPHVITKLMMSKRVQDVRHILPITFVGYTLSALLWISIGLVMRALVLNGDHPPLASADDAASQFLQHFANPLLAGVVFAGLFAAIMSTADGFLNVGTAAIIHDIPKAIRGRSIGNELFWARIFTVLIAVGASLVAIFSGQDYVALLGTVGWGIFAAALVPTVAIGFNWKRASATSVNAAIISSLGVNFFIRITTLISEMGHEGAPWPFPAIFDADAKFWNFAIPYGVDPGAISLVVSLTLFFAISLAMKPPKLDPDVEAVMDL